MRNKLNDAYAFPDRIKSVLRACSEGKLSWNTFISQVTKPIFKSIPEHSEH